MGILKKIGIGIGVVFVIVIVLNLIGPIPLPTGRVTEIQSEKTTTTITQSQCTEGSYRCVGQNLERCVTGEWQFTKSCEYMCSNDHCVAQTTTTIPTTTSTSTPSIITTTIPTTTTQQTVKPEILSYSSYTSSIGYFTVVGEVKNTLQSNINFVKITATFYDAQKNVIGTDFTFTDLNIMKPNQKSPFELSSFPDKITPDSFKLTVSYSQTGSIPFIGLEILSHTSSIDSIGYYKTVGEIKNNGDRKSTYVKIVATYYDSTGKVIGKSFTFTDPIDIDVGDTAPFSLSSYPNKISPSSYELQVQGQ